MTKTKDYKDCQSCGMPLRRDEKGGGTEVDGTKSSMYCSHCYEAGRFTLPDVTVSQMQERVKGKIKEAGFPGFLAGLFTRKIPKLERWNRR
ncbi:MAG: zinc ribbon domain-containing protein [Acidobacteriota bacterium]